MKRLIVDLDNTITIHGTGTYTTVAPNVKVIEKLRLYRKMGFEIVISTSRNMRTYNGNIGKITANTLPIIFEWLKMHDVPYDEVLVGKPWCGTDGFYIDDRAVRPDEFVKMEYSEIVNMIGSGDKQC